MREIIQEILGDLKSAVFFPADSIGFILGLLLVILEIFFAAIIFPVN